MWVREIFSKIIALNVFKNKDFTIVSCRRCVSMIENRISGFFYNEPFGKSNEEKCTVFQNMAWSLIVPKNTINNCSTALQAFSFRSLSFVSFFIKVRILLQFFSQMFRVLYMFSPFSFLFS